jgi:DNA polymerase-3 subunit delta
MKPLELQKEIRKGNFSPLYFFYGDESFLVEKTVKEMLLLLVAPEHSDFNLSVFYGNESTSRDILNAARTAPLLTDRRVVLVKEADQLKPSSWNEFSSYFTAPVSSTCMIFCARRMMIKADLLKTFKKHGRAVRFYHPFEREIPEWIRKIAKEFHKNISREAVTLLNTALENDLQQIYSELEKIALFVGEKSLIEDTDVREALVDAKSANVFDLIDRIGNRDLEGSLHALKILLDAGEPPLKILTMITNRVRLLAKVKEMLQEGIPAAEIGRGLGMSDFYLKGILKQAPAFPLAQTETYFSHLFHSDWDLKSRRINKGFILEKLIADMCSL